MRLIDSIIDKYGQLSADDLSEITHKPGGLWDIAKKKYNPNLIEGDEEKISVYNDAYEIAIMC